MSSYSLSELGLNPDKNTPDPICTSKEAEFYGD